MKQSAPSQQTTLGNAALRTYRDDAFGYGDNHQIHHISGIQFFHQMPAVRIHRIGRYTQFLSYLLRTFSLRK